MFKKVLFILSVLVFAIGVLSASIIRSASPFVKSFYLSAETIDKENAVDASSEEITYEDYVLPYPGRILPDSPLWFLKAGRDKVWLFLTRKPQKRAELQLLFADKRLVSARMLFEKDKPELGLSTLSKAEKYLEQAKASEKAAHDKGVDTNSLLLSLSKASLMHRFEIEENILKMAPSDAKPEILKLVDYPKKVFESSRNTLLDRGMEAPKDPFDGEN